jgi:hypothetical protein
VLLTGTFALLRGATCSGDGCAKLSTIAGVVLVWWFGGMFLRTIRDDGLRKALHLFWPLLALAGVAAVVILTHVLGLW